MGMDPAVALNRRERSGSSSTCSVTTSGGSLVETSVGFASWASVAGTEPATTTVTATATALRIDTKDLRSAISSLGFTNSGGIPGSRNASTRRQAREQITRLAPAASSRGYCAGGLGKASARGYASDCPRSLKHRFGSPVAGVHGLMCYVAGATLALLARSVFNGIHSRYSEHHNARYKPK